MRLGDFDALKATINNAVDEEIRFDLAWAMGLKYSLKLIDNAPIVAVDCKDCDGYEAGYSAGLKDAERPQGEWIPVNERLPEQGNQSYLVTVDYDNGVVCSCQRFFFNEDIGWNDDCVIAWQPLPEPYMRGGAV